MRYDVEAYDGRDADSFAVLRQVARSRIARELRELEKKLGERLSYAVIRRPIVTGSSSSVLVGVAIRGGVGWSVAVSSERAAQ